MRIGLAWQGNPKASIDGSRSIPLASLAPLGRLQGVRLISLQKENGRDQIAELPGDVRLATQRGSVSSNKSCSTMKVT